MNIDRLSGEEIVRLMNEEDRKIAAAVAQEIPAIARAVEAIVIECKMAAGFSMLARGRASARGAGCGGMRTHLRYLSQAGAGFDAAENAQ